MNERIVLPLIVFDLAFSSSSPMRNRNAQEARIGQHAATGW
jgi:hypothetical protein